MDGINFERRKHKRISGTFVVSYASMQDKKLKFDVSQTRDLSEGGLSFVSDRQFEKNVILKIKLRLPDSSDYVVLKAQVVESKQIAKGLMYKIMAKFMDLDQDIKDAIKKLVENEK